MFLAIDIGNSNIKLGLFDGGTWVCTKRVPTPTMQKPEVVTPIIQSFLSEVQIEPTKVTAAGVASVVPSLTEHITNAITELCGVAALVVSSEVALPITIDIDNPEKVGADRIANAVSGFAKANKTVIVVDMGTASKFDVVTKSGLFIGGVIAPGAVTSLLALAGTAAQLFDVAFEKPERVIGRNTTGAMQSGAYFGTVGQIDYIVERILTELKISQADCMILGTGGLIDTVAGDSKFVKVIQPELTLDGIFRIAQKNDSGTA